MPQVVMSDAIYSDVLTRAIKSLLAFANTKHLCVQRFIRTLAAHSFKQCASLWNQWHPAQFPIFSSCLGIAAHNDFTRFKIHISDQPGPAFGLGIRHPIDAHIHHYRARFDHICFDELCQTDGRY